MSTEGPVRCRLLHASLAVTDLDRSVVFYGEAFGAQVVLFERDMTDLIRRTTGIAGLTCDLAQLRLPTPGPLVELIHFDHIPPGHEDAAPLRVGHGHICLGVTEFDAAVRRAETCGARPVGEVVAYPDGRSVYLREPGGSVIELEEVDGEPAHPA